MARETGLFYLHDTIGGSQAIDSKEHRALFAKLAKRSRYFIVNPGKIDQPHVRGGQIEVGNRYFEGAAWRRSRQEYAETTRHLRTCSTGPEL